jgi:hypothetical protein
MLGVKEWMEKTKGAARLFAATEAISADTASW